MGYSYGLIWATEFRKESFKVEWGKVRSLPGWSGEIYSNKFFW